MDFVGQISMLLIYFCDLCVCVCVCVCQGCDRVLGIRGVCPFFYAFLSVCGDVSFTDVYGDWQTLSVVRTWFIHVGIPRVLVRVGAYWL